MLPDVVPPAKSSMPAVPVNSSAGSSNVKAVPEVRKTEPLYSPRPVGRPPTVAVLTNPQTTVSSNTVSSNTIIPVPMADNYVPDLNPPHNCQVFHISACCCSGLCCLHS
jgi:hypothetical protein